MREYDYLISQNGSPRERVQMQEAEDLRDSVCEREREAATMRNMRGL